MKKFVWFYLVAVMCTACSSRFSTNAEHQYLASRNGENLIIPSPLSDENISHFYDLPAQNQDAHVSVEPPTTPRSGLNHVEEKGT